MGDNPEMSQLLCPVVVGREQELAEIAEALDQAVASRGGALLLIGEAGLGKSRLVREAAALARGQGIRVLVGRAVAEGRAGSFRALSEALLSAFRGGQPPDDPELAPFRIHLGRVVPQWKLLSEPVGDGANNVMLAEGLVRVLRSIAGDAGCLIVLEDLHWADAETLSVLDYLADNLTGERVLCLATVRTGEHSPAERQVRQLSARRAARVLELTHLSTAETKAMATACLDVPLLPDRLGQSISERAEGVPFLVEELLAGLVAQGAVHREAGQWAFQDEDEKAPLVPLGFAETVRTRLGALGDEGRAVLNAAAVLGRRFDWTLVPVVAEMTQPVVTRSLSRAVHVQLLAADGGFRFRHALTRDAVLNEQLPPEHVELCRRALRAVEGAHPGLPGVWCDLAAELAVDAGDQPGAASLLLEAGRRALATGSLATAETVLERARNLAADDPHAVDEIDDVLTEVLALAGKVQRVFEVGTRLLGRLDGTHNVGGMPAEVHLRLARAAIAAGDWAVANDHVSMAREFGVDAADPRLSARIEVLAAQVAIGDFRLDEAVRYASRTLEIAEKNGLPDVVCEALEILGRRARQRDLEEAETFFERARKLAEQHGLELWRVRATHELGTIDLLACRGRGRLIEARDGALRLGALATAAVADLQAGYAMIGSAALLEQVLQIARRCEDTARRLRLTSLLAMTLVMQGGAFACLGHRAEMEAALAEADALAPDDLDVQGAIPGILGQFWMLQEQRSKALAELERGMNIAPRKTKAGGIPTFPGLWALASAVENRDGGAAVAEVRQTKANVHAVTRAYLSHADAVNLGRAGRSAEASAQAKTAITQISALCDVDIDATLAMRLMAEAALRDGWGTPVSWLEHAHAYFRATGHQEVAAACERLLGERVPPRLPAGLSERECEVLRLVAAGQTNRQIASALYISDKTVARHLSNIFTKIGVSNRSAAAGFAFRQEIALP